MNVERNSVKRIIIFIPRRRLCIRRSNRRILYLRKMASNSFLCSLIFPEWAVSFVLYSLRGCVRRRRPSQFYFDHRRSRWPLSNDNVDFPENGETVNSVGTNLPIKTENTLRLHFQMIRVPVTAFFTYVCWLKINWTHPLWPVVYCSVSKKVRERGFELILFTGHISFRQQKPESNRVTKCHNEFLHEFSIFSLLFFLNLINHIVKHLFFSSGNFRDVLISLKETIRSWNRSCGKYLLCWFYSPTKTTWKIWKKLKHHLLLYDICKVNDSAYYLSSIAPKCVSSLAYVA